jgi:hypothetical protein
MSGVPSVTANECSKWADSLLSAVTTIQPSSKQFGFPRSHINHWFQGNGQPFSQPNTPPRFTIIGYLWIFVHIATHTVPGILSDNTKTLLSQQSLYCRGDIAGAITKPGLFNAPVQSLFSYIKGAALQSEISPTGMVMPRHQPTLVVCTTVNTENVTNL